MITPSTPRQTSRKASGGVLFLEQIDSSGSFGDDVSILPRLLRRRAQGRLRAAFAFVL